MRFEASPAIELESLTAEILSIEAAMRAGCGFQRSRLIELLERRAEVERELGLDVQAAYGK
jgi:hypothetical protein